MSAPNGSACSYVYVPSAADAGKRCRAVALLAVGGEAVTLVTPSCGPGSGAGVTGAARP